MEDTAHLIIGFTHKIDDKIKLIASVNLDFIRHDTTRLCTAIGDMGSLRWNGLAGTVEQFNIKNKTWDEIYRDTEEDSYVSEWKHFVNCVSGHEEPLICGGDGLKVLEIIAAARQSSLDKVQVKVVYEKPKE